MKSFLLTFLIPLFFFLGLFISLETETAIGFGNLWLGSLGILGCFLGLLLWIWGFLSLGQSFSVLPKAKKLQTRGIYKYCRHPIYLGIGLSSLGISVSLGSWFGLIYTIFIVIPLNMMRIKGEEKVLLMEFGEEYKEYMKRVLI